ncbi:hypothetical protein ACLIBH_00740 [Virgibacillus sp. W0430]|uniref:hypothetical protein n=1 Tax=Virgibacillus sp. W0430 TaxID=3391580 RepID=UPI003F4467C9
MRDYVVSIVKQTIHEFLQQDRSNRAEQILVLLPEESSIYDMQHLNQLAATYNLTLAVTNEDFQPDENVPVINVARVAENERKLLVNEFDLLYVPTISHGFLAKLSLLIDDTKPIWLTLHMLLEGKPVILGQDQIIRKRSSLFFPKPSIEKKVQNYMKQLMGDGVTFCSQNKVAAKISSVLAKEKNRRPLVLAKHIEELVRDGEKEVTIPAQSIVTPMAKDAARELGMAIKKETKK